MSAGAEPLPVLSAAARVGVRGGAVRDEGVV